jgi:vancomycin permeability regulator SanA
MRFCKPILLVCVACYLFAAAAIALAGLSDRLVPADAIVILGNTVMPDGQPSARLRARLDCALAAYRQKLAPWVIVSGGVGKEGHDEAVVMARYLVEHGVPAAAVLVDSAGNDTAASAANIARIASEKKLKSVLVASQYFHVPRARLALSRAGVAVAGTVHANYVEARDLYSLAREVIAFGAYFVGLKAPAAQPTGPDGSTIGTVRQSIAESNC